MDVLLSPYLLAFSGVSKRFPDGTVALSGVHLSVGAGEFVSILRPSGCGKPPCSAGLSRVSEGSAQVGTDQIGYVLQDPTLLPWRTVQANVELFAELRRLPRDERRRRATEALNLVGLGDFARH